MRRVCPYAYTPRLGTMGPCFLLLAASRDMVSINFLSNKMALLKDSVKVGQKW
jgi:hypothetical protein